MVKRNYLAYSSFLQAAVEAMPLDEKTKAKLRYDMGQFIDAMSPANFLATNPEAMQLAVETGGQSLDGRNASVLRRSGQRSHLDDRRDRLRGGPQPRDDAGCGHLRERADAGDPVRARDRARPRAAAADHSAVHQQVLHPRPAAGEFVRALRRRAEATRCSWCRGATSRRARPPDLGRLPGAGRHAGDRRRAERHAAPTR